MSEYIEDRISSLENRVSDLERHYNLLHTRVNDLEDRIENHNNDITLLKEDLGKMGKEIDRLRCEVRGTEYLDPLTDKPVDQSTEEFVRVKHGHWICKDMVEYEECICSVCGGENFGENYMIGSTAKYCPHCGAKMDLKDGE